MASTSRKTSKRKKTVEAREEIQSVPHRRPPRIEWIPNPDPIEVKNSALMKKPLVQRMKEFKERGKHAFIYEKRLDLDFLYGLQFIEMFKRQGQENIYQLHTGREGHPGTVVYEKACMEFIAGIYKWDHHSITSDFRGKDLTITVDDISNRFELEDHADTDYVCKYFSFDRKGNIETFVQMVQDISYLSYEEAMDLFRKEVRGHLPRKLLKHYPRMLAKFINHNILPKKSELSRIRDDEVFLIHSLYTGYPLYNMSWIIICSWLEALNNKRQLVIPFPIILSTILKEEGRIYKYKELINPLQPGVSVKVGDVPVYPKHMSLNMGKDVFSDSVKILRWAGGQFAIQLEDPRQGANVIITLPIRTQEKLETEKECKELEEPEEPISQEIPAEEFEALRNPGESSEHVDNEEMVRLRRRIDELQVDVREIRGDIGGIRGDIGDIRGGMGEMKGMMGEML